MPLLARTLSIDSVRRTLKVFTAATPLSNQGTRFLDEAGDIPLQLQAKLLRFCKSRNFERLGSDRTHKGS